jgi:hypothetical protein
MLKFVGISARKEALIHAIFVVHDEMTITQQKSLQIETTCTTCHPLQTFGDK